MPRKRTEGVTVSTGGSESMRRRKQRPIMIGVSEAQHKMIRLAAAERGVPISHLVRDAVLEEAEKILKKSANVP